MSRKLTGWFVAQSEEIASDRILRYYGVALSAVMAVAFLDWRFVHRIAEILQAGALPVCWPFWEDCYKSRVFPASTINVVLWTMLALSLAAGAAFLRPRLAKWGYWLLLAASAVRLLVYGQDFRLHLNQHYMLNWVVLVFLFLPWKRATIPQLLVSFYFWAGVLKLNMEWLSGAALYNRDRLWIPDAWIPASCVYVVVLEMGIIFGLYSRRAWLYWATFAQLLLFHVMSLWVVGLFYPLLMFGLISIFATIRLLEPQSNALSLAAFRDRRYRPVLPALLVVFGLFQLAPRAFPGDVAITGEGRLLALNMFDAQVVCEGNVSLRRRDNTTVTARVQTDQLPKRIACDPIVYFDLAQANCRKYAQDERFVDFDLHLRSRRTSDDEFRTVIDVKNFCSANLHYDMWRPNSWILK